MWQICDISDLRTGHFVDATKHSWSTFTLEKSGLSVVFAPESVRVSSSFLGEERKRKSPFCQNRERQKGCGAPGRILKQ